MTQNPGAVSPAPPAPPAPTAPKKGLPPLAWVAIGCGGLLILGLIVLLAGGYWAAGKAKQAMEGFEENPAQATAELLIRANPELELVESDREAGTITVRNKETGEVATVGLEDIEEGRVTFESGGKKSSVTFGGEDQEGFVAVTDEEGNETFRVGSGSGDKIPEWVPVYPGTEPAGAYHMSSGQTVNGTFSLATDDGLDEVADYYESELTEAGYQVHKTTMSGPDGESILLAATADQRQVTVMTSRQEGQTQAVVSYSQGE